LLELALHYGKGPLMMQTIAEKQGVSRKYLDAIFASLKSAGLVRSRRGAGGGHLLARDPNDIKLGDIFRALDGPVALVDCVSDPQICGRSHRCVTKSVWGKVSDAIEATLNSFTLGDLVREHHELESGACPADLSGAPTAGPVMDEDDEDAPAPPAPPT
jgi:Rrf2 family cysteine metabolism transcriptional repressor